MTFEAPAISSITKSRNLDSGPPRKYYRLTAKGKSQLNELNEYWKDINATISQLGR
jgi:DNA-binding PadR family transcriptional regulator